MIRSRIAAWVPAALLQGVVASAQFVQPATQPSPEQAYQDRVANQQQIQAIEQRQRELQQQQQQRQANQQRISGSVSDFMNAAQQGKETEKQQNGQGIIQTAIGGGMVATSATLYGIAAATPDPATQQTLKDIALMTLVMGVGQLATGAVSFAQGGASGESAAKNQTAAAQRAGTQGGSGTSGIGFGSGNQGMGSGTGAGLNGGTSGLGSISGLGSSGSNQPREPLDLAKQLGPGAMENYQKLEDMKPGLGDYVYGKIQDGKTEDEIRESLSQMMGTPIPSSNDKRPFDELAKHSQLIASSLDGAGLPYADTIAMIQNPEAFGLKALESGSTGNDLSQSAKFEALNDQSQDVIEQSIKLQSPENTIQPLLGSSLDSKKYGIDFKDLFSKNTDLDAKAFGQNQNNLFAVEDISPEAHRSVFELVTARYTALIHAEFRSSGKVIRGKFVHIGTGGKSAKSRAALPASVVNETVTSLKGSNDATPISSLRPKKSGRVPAFIP